MKLKMFKLKPEFTAAVLKLRGSAPQRVIAKQENEGDDWTVGNESRGLCLRELAQRMAGYVEESCYRV